MNIGAFGEKEAETKPLDLDPPITRSDTGDTSGKDQSESNFYESQEAPAEVAACEETEV